jgi:hypothetical protein
MKSHRGPSKSQTVSQRRCDTALDVLRADAALMVMGLLALLCASQLATSVFDWSTTLLRYICHRCSVYWVSCSRVLNFMLTKEI